MWDVQQFSEVEVDSQREQLRKQERVWFNWVCRLHDVHTGTQTPQSAAILAIAQRRWADARGALDRAEEQAMNRPESIDFEETRAPSGWKRAD